MEPEKVDHSLTPCFCSFQKVYLLEQAKSRKIYLNISFRSLILNFETCTKSTELFETGH